MDEEIVIKPCKKCKVGQPKIKKLPGELFYAQCDKNCGLWDPYEFCGVTYKSALRNWNIGNDPITITKKKTS